MKKVSTKHSSSEVEMGHNEVAHEASKNSVAGVNKLVGQTNDNKGVLSSKPNKQY